MSQISTFQSGASMGAVLTLTADSGLPTPIVPPDGTGTIYLLGALDSGITTQAVPGANIIYFNFAGSQIVSVQTTDATPTTLWTLTLAASSAISVRAQIVAAQDDYSAALGANLVGTARRGAAGGSVEVVDKQDFAEDFVGINPSYDLNVVGNDVIIQVIGGALTTINWKAIVTYTLLNV